MLVKKGKYYSANNTNVITIEKNVPLPNVVTRHDVERYSFLNNMEVGDSFAINGNTPDFTPVGVRSFIYQQNAKRHHSLKYTVRTTSGRSGFPRAIRVWRTK